MRSRSLFVLPVVAVAAIAGVLAGSVAARSVAPRATATTTDVVSEEPVGPDAPPPMTDGFPDASEPYLRDVTMESLEQGWREAKPDWSCERNAGTAGDSISCTTTDPFTRHAINVHITNEYQEPERVRSVRGDCRYTGPGALDSSRCRSFFTEVSDLVFATQDASTREQATRWVRNNFESDNSTVIGGIRVSADLGLQWVTFESELAPAPG